MKIQRSHKIRLCPNNRQANYFARACGVARFTYNWGLSEWRKQYEAGQKPNWYGLARQFNSTKKQKFPFVTEVTKYASARAFVNLSKAFQNFFRNVKAGRKPGYPRYKRKGIRNSFYLGNDVVKFDDKYVRVPKLGWVKMREALRFEGKVLSATISRIADMWFMAVRVEQEIVKLVPASPVLGVDVGIKNLAVVSDGRVFENPKALKRAEVRLRMFQKSVSRKQKRSQNRKKAALQLQKQHYRVSCIRKDSLHKATTAITNSCSALGVEDLNVKGLQRNRRLSKALSDASLAEFLRQIEYKAQQLGVVVVKADRFYPSSKTCSSCGHVKTKLALSERTYKCECCGLVLDRDLNAAVNLRNLAVGSTVSACCLGSSGSSSKSETTDWAGISRKSAS